jgi:hypothetical protein
VTGELALGLLIAHLAGDYVLQSDWMATGKLSRWWPAIAHGVTYTIPFALLALTLGGISPLALAIICGTHIVIDRYRLAKYLVWLKNQVGARREYAYRVPRGPVTLTGGIDFAEAGTGRRRVDPMAWPPSATGYPAHVPAGVATILMIVADNTVHLAINWAAVVWL